MPPMPTLIASAPPEASNDWRTPATTGLIVLAVGLGTFLLWAATARLDSAVLAPGVVSVETNRKTVQHLEGGIVREILVRDGDQVEAGQVLLRLDPTRTDSVGDLYQEQLAVQLAQEARLLAERDRADEVRFPAEVERQTGEDIVARAVSDQKQQFAVKRDTLLRAIETADAQIAQSRQDLQQNDNDGRTAEATLGILKKELAGVRVLYEKNLVALPRLSALEREQLRLQGVIDNSAAGAKKLNERIQELSLKRDQLTEDYRQEAAAKLVEVRKSIAELRQQLVVANDAQHRIAVRAPTKGTVQQLRVFTVGGVVRPGEPILDIVPATDNLIIKARISPVDADRILADMDAEIRFPSFRYFGFDVIHGRVHAVSRDRLLDETTKEPYFDAQVSIDRAHLPGSLAGKLVAGMPAEVIVPTGARTVFDYLTTPLAERFNTSMRER